MVAPVALIRDEDCPECGWPETYAEVDFSAATPGADAIGCRKCGWRVEAIRLTPNPDMRAAVLHAAGLTDATADDAVYELTAAGRAAQADPPHDA